ncbi:hypothetical protein B7991_11135 [Fibrobacter sp. UWB3]|nr:hypothetical protein B7991_11135 [Fibrobacter sp. UWB3]
MYKTKFTFKIGVYIGILFMQHFIETFKTVTEILHKYFFTKSFLYTSQDSDLLIAKLRASK